GYRRDHEHTAVAALRHTGEHQSGQVNRGHEIDIELTPPVVGRQLGHTLARRVNTGPGEPRRGDQDVHRPKSLVSVCHHALGVGDDGEITDGRGRLGTLTSQLLGADVYAVGRRGEGKACTKLRERPGAGEPDAGLASTTGDQGDVAGEVGRTIVW